MVSMAMAPAAGGSSKASSSSKKEGGERRRGGLRRLLAHARPEAGRMAVAFLALLGSSATNIAMPTIMGKVIDRASDVVARDRVPLRSFLGAVFAVFVGGAACSVLRVHSLAIAGDRLSRRMRKQFFGAVLRQDRSFFDARKTGDLMNRLQEDVDIASAAVTKNAANGLRSFSSVFNGTMMLLYLSRRLTAVSLLSAPLVGLCAMLMSKLNKSNTRRLKEAVADVLGFAGERLGSISTVRNFAREPQESARFAEDLDATAPLASSVAFGNGLFMGGLSLSLNTTLLAVLSYGGQLVSRGQMTVGNLTSFAIYSSLVGLGTSGLTAAYSDLMKAVVSSERVFEFIDNAPGVDIDDGDEFEAVEGALRFEDVGFCYPQRPDNVILDGVSFDIAAGSVVALAGASGCGKSTIAALITRLYEPTHGRVTLDGCDLSSLRPLWLREQVVGIVEQEPVLFDGSIAENIRYGKPEATDAEVESAARDANAHEFISTFSEGYATRVGEKGKQLSGGEKQRVAIARALIKSPRFLLLDEATSALDGESERQVQQAIDSIIAGRSRCTVLIIAHRMSTIQCANKVVVLEEGRVAEEGTFDELMAKGGVFAQLNEGL